MTKTKIYHNPRCGKSRETLKLLESKGIAPEIVLYLEKPPTKRELKQVINLLGIKPIDLIRKGESEFKENFKGKTLSDDEWIDAMLEFPKLIERPIVITNGKAALGRPPENVLEIL